MQAYMFWYKVKYSNSIAHYKEIGGSAMFQRGNNKTRKSQHDAKFLFLYLSF